MGETEAGGQSVQIPQPLEIKMSDISENAFIKELIINMYANADFDGSGKSPDEIARETIYRAQVLVDLLK